MNLKSTIHYFLGALFLTAGVGSSYAVPAFPGVIEAAQPDGTSVSIRLVGDERNHRAYSSDGYLLTADHEGFYVFANVDDAGLPVATDIRNINPETRTARDIAAISKLDREKIAAAFSKKDGSRKMNAPMRGPGLASTKFPSTGKQRSLAVLVEFQDNEFTIENPQEHYYRMLNEENYSEYDNAGSVRDFFVQNSSGLFDPTFDVYGPVKLSRNMSYYGGMEDEMAYMMAVEACQQLDDEVDFSQYDCNDDGYIDNVYVYYAGYGQADGGGYNTVWPHSWDVEYATYTKYFFDGVQLNHYACSNELRKNNSTPDGVGPFLHEFSHVMGLPDLYCTDENECFTPGAWSILDAGSYNMKSCYPPNYSAYERYALDWMTPELITASGEYSLRPIDESNRAFLVPTEKEEEYFLIENRQFNNWDTYIPWHGMLVWHVDFNQYAWDYNIVNNNPNHQRVDLVEADNIQTPNTRVSDSFPGRSNVTSFTATTQPAFVSWGKVPVGVNIYDITEDEDGTITFRVELDNPSDAGVSSTPAGNAVSVSGSSIICKGKEAVVYDTTGRIVAKLQQGDAKVLPEGMYIAVSEGRSVKFAIK